MATLHSTAGLGRFFYRGAKSNTTQYRNYCKATVDEYERLNPVDTEGMELVEATAAKQALREKAIASLGDGVLGYKPAWLAHILGGQGIQACVKCPEEARKEAKELDNRKRTGTALGKKAAEKRKRTDEQQPIPTDRPAKKSTTEDDIGPLDTFVFKGLDLPFSDFDKELIEIQAERAVVAGNLAEDIFTQPEMVQLFRLFRSRATDVLPSRRLIGGRLLDDAVKRVDKIIVKKLTSRLVGIELDGWRRFRKGVTGICANDRGKVSTLEVLETTAGRKDGEGMAAFYEETIIRVEAKFGCIVIYVVTDADGGSKKGRDLLLEKRPDLFTPSCAAHQCQLYLGDYLKTSAVAKRVSEDAIALICWINNHDKVRIIFDDSQRIISPDQNADGRVIILAYMVANLTRWTSHATAFLRLDRLERAIVSAARTSRNAIIAAQVGSAKSTEGDRLRREATAMCDLIEDRSFTFWGPLKQVIRDMEPICLATNINQQDATRPDEVLLTLAGMYLHFAAHDDDKIRDGMVKRLEKRWKDMDQSLMVLSLILNPFEILCRFGPNAPISRLKLRKLFIEVFGRVQSSPHNKDDNETKTAKREAAVMVFLEYLSTTGDWKEFMEDIETWTGDYGKDPFKVYEFMTGSSLGMTEFCKFATHLLSVVMNTAGTERLFSNLKLRLDDRRARTKIEKLAKKARVGEQIRREHAEKKLISVSESRKRHNHAAHARLLTVERYSDLLDNQDDEDETERGRQLVQGEAGWRTELARWIGMARAAELQESDDLPTPQEVSAEVRAAAAAKWTKVTLESLFKGAKPPPRPSLDEIDARADVDYLNDLADAEEDAIPHDGAVYDEADTDYRP
ncbi:DUF659 domain-containing protein [Mycena chlorophos]|uniref:DUF659 domain-containing protein n=1 Tax=Mycena chlorophos TaxID=658473 RepID=A0A8H6SBB4_MYCCL|nr:DUF659 domain-containing protein [Mycena chlorophos]